MREEIREGSAKTEDGEIAVPKPGAERKARVSEVSSQEGKAAAGDGKESQSEEISTVPGGDQVITAVADIEILRECMRLHLEQMKESGVDLYLDGHSVLPGEAVAKAVRENSPYMADYVLDAAGVIEQVRFDRVTRS